MRGYSSPEYVNMILLHGRANYHANGAVCLYGTRYSNARHLSAHAILGAFGRLIETSSVLLNHCLAGALRWVRNPANKERIIRFIEENLEIGIRGIKVRSELSYGTVQYTIQSEELHAHHYTRVNALQPKDYPVRLQFCRQLLKMDEHDNTLWTDKFTFQHEGS